jgi:hypothetical protein
MEESSIPSPGFPYQSCYAYFSGNLFDEVFESIHPSDVEFQHDIAFLYLDFQVVLRFKPDLLGDAFWLESPGYYPTSPLSFSRTVLLCRYGAETMTAG